MAMDEQTLRDMLLEGIPDAQVRIEDLRGDGDHYAAYIVSPAFIGQSRVQQHKMVHKALKGKLTNELHALAIQTSAPSDK